MSIVYFTVKLRNIKQIVQLMWCDILFLTAAEELCVVVEWYISWYEWYLIYYEYLRVIELVGPWTYDEVYLLGVLADDL